MLLKKNKTEKNDTKRQITKRAKNVKKGNPSTDLLEEQIDHMKLKWAKLATAAAFGGLVLFLGVFFTSDIQDRIVHVKQQDAYAASIDHVAGESNSSDALHIAIIGDTKLGKQDVIDYLDSLDDKAFETFKQALLSKLGSLAIPGEGDAKSLAESLLTGQITSKTQLIDYLQSMDSTEFDVFIKAIGSVDQTTKNTSTATNRVLKPTLKDAYAEAEKLYPGKINGSKRLKLIADLNAGSYLYYVAEQGDTLLKLSHAFHVPLGQLVELNGIHDADVINAGDILLFPADTKQPVIPDKSQE